MAGGKLNSGVLEQGGARHAGWMNNIAIVNATTTNAADSIKITGSDGTALSASNYGWITLPSATAGRLVTLSMTADVTINLTGAHWGFGTKGDLTNYILYVYAINDAGTLRWGAGAKPNRNVVLDADDTATATSVTTYEKVLINSLLTGGANAYARVVGWFKASFDDTGGAAEDLWAVQTGVGDIQQGSLNIEAIPMVPGYMQNIGLANATTTNANDSIKITSADGQALSVRNLGWIVLPGETVGQLQVMPVSADVTLNITGAHWGAGTKGDLTDAVLHVYAINDARILKWGVAQLSNLAVALNADDQTTATNVTTSVGVFVNSALTADANCRVVGWFKASFDDTGGAAEDLWAVQTGVGDIGFGHYQLVRRSYMHINGTDGTPYGSTDTKILRFATVDTSIGGDVTRTSTAGNGDIFIINAHGMYSISTFVYFADDVLVEVGFTLNSSQLTTDISGTTASTQLMIQKLEVTAALTKAHGGTVSWRGFLNIGDLVRVHTAAGALKNSTSHLFTIFSG